MPNKPIVGIFHGTNDGTAASGNTSVLQMIAAQLRSDSNNVDLLEATGVGAAERQETNARPSRSGLFARKVRNACHRLGNIISGNELDEIIENGFNQLKAKIEVQISNQNNEDIQISLVGFSRGGAASLVIANRLAEHFSDPNSDAYDEHVKINLNMIDAVPGGNRYNQQQYHELSPHLNFVTNIVALNETRTNYQVLHTANMHMPGPASAWERKVLEFGLPCVHSALVNPHKRPDALAPVTNITDSVLRHGLIKNGCEALDLENWEDGKHHIGYQFQRLKEVALELRTAVTSRINRLFKGGGSAGTRNSARHLGEVDPRNKAFNVLHESQETTVEIATAEQQFFNLVDRYRPSRDFGHLSLLRWWQRHQLKSITSLPQAFDQYMKMRGKKVTELTSILRDYLYDAGFKHNPDNKFTDDQAIKLGRLRIFQLDLQKAGCNSLRGSLLQQIADIQAQAENGVFDSNAYNALLTTCQNQSDALQENDQHLSDRKKTIDRFLQAEGLQYRYKPEKSIAIARELVDSVEVRERPVQATEWDPDDDTRSSVSSNCSGSTFGSGDGN